MNFIKRLKLAPLKKAFDDHDTVLTSGSFSGRADCDLQIDLTMKGLNNAAYLSLAEGKNGLYLNVMNVFRSFNLVFGNVKHQATFKQKLYLASVLNYMIGNHDSLIELFAGSGPGISQKRYVAFHSSFGIEALTCQFFNLLNVKTFTLSHGISYINYKKSIPADHINGENITADTVLVWGQSSADDLINNFNIPADRIKVAGNLKYPEKKIDVLQSFRSGIVLLGRGIYDKGNQQIIAIISDLVAKHNIDFTVKLHPTLNFEYYEALCQKYNINIITDKLELTRHFESKKYDFAIVNNSTAYYEAMYHNLICFRYEPDENEEFKGLDDKFHDPASLLEKIDRFKNIDTSSVNMTVAELLVETLGMGLNNYKQEIQGANS